MNTPLPRYVVLDKTVGETPLQALEAWRSESGIAHEVPLAYAGRLDPMASGKLLILVGDECKRQSDYHGLDKEYRFEVLLGVRSDTGDVLGMPTTSPEENLSIGNESEETIHRALRSLRGTHHFRYPRFSAKTVRGIPLHEWTLRGGLRDDEIPTYEAKVLQVRLLSVRTVSARELRDIVQTKITSVPPVTDPRKALGADFRRGDIIPAWDALLTNSDRTFTVVEASAIVASGTYIRTLSEELGKLLGSSALALSIHRTTLGRFWPLIRGWGFWYRTLR